MPPDAFMFDTSGQLVMQTAIGGAGTLFGPLVGAAVWLYLSDFFQTTLHLGATWKLVLGVVFVLLVVFLRHGIVGGLVSLWQRMFGGARHSEPADPIRTRWPRCHRRGRQRRRPSPRTPRPPAVDDGELILEARGLTKRYGGILANDNIDFSVRRGELRGVIGPNGAGKTTFFKMLTCEVHPIGRAHPVRGPRHHRLRRHRRVPAWTDQELPGQSAVHAADRAREHHDRRACREARTVPSRPAAQYRQRHRPSRSGSRTRSGSCA